MKHYLFYLLMSLLILFSCRSRVATQQLIQTQVDSTITLEESATGLRAILSMKDSIPSGSPIEMTFSVVNPADSIQRFCKWHTPFEPFISLYLDIRDHEGNRVMYKGAMAKRVMPPPPEAYFDVQAGDTLSTTIDLSDGYALKEPGKYHIVYRGQVISGIETANEINFVLVK